MIMEEKSRIKFNPVTKEIEIEGSESFVKVYFGKIQKLLSVQEEIPVKKAAKAKRSLKEPVKKRGDIFDIVMKIINESDEGETTATLKEKTDLTEQQIRSVIYRAKKQGKIQKVKRGVYLSA